MNVFVVDNPCKEYFAQGLWVYFKPSEYKTAERLLETLIEWYKEEEADVSPLEYILECLNTREHPN